MTDPKRVLRGVQDLGQAIDRRRGATEATSLIRQEQLQSGVLPTSGGGGSGGGTGDPVFPERYVESVMAEGETAGLDGAVVICGREGAEVTQSSANGEITITCPDHTAADGVELSDDEFRCDSTVVRTTGIQSIEGTKSFGEFPVTPDGFPGEPLEVANKSYVDDCVPDVYWRRSGQLSICPLARDAIEIKRSGLETALLCLKGSDVSAGFVVRSDGAMSWGSGSATPDVTLKRSGIKQLELDTGGLLRLPVCVDLGLVSSTELTEPAEDWLRIQACDSGRVYATEESGVCHDLCVQHKQVVSGRLLTGDIPGAGAWSTAKYPAAAVSAAPAEATCPFSFNFSTGGLTTSHGTWEVDADGSSDLIQSQLAIGTPFRKYGDGTNRDGNSVVTIKARIRVSNPDSLDNLYLYLNDQGTNLATEDILADLTSNTWAEVTLAAAGTDVTAWGNALRTGILARGSSTLTTQETWTLDLEWLSIEQWCG